MNTVKFNKYHVTNGDIKARVFYHLDGRIDGKKCVILYAKDYTDSLGKIFGKYYENETDIMTDYFDKGSVTLFEDHPLYVKARIRAQAILLSRESNQ